MFKLKQRVLSFLQLPATLLDPLVSDTTSTITQLSPLVQFSAFDYKNRTLAFMQVVNQPAMTSALFGVVFDPAGLQVESVTQNQVVGETKIISFKSSKEYRNQEAAVVALRSTPSALSINQQIQVVKLTK